MNTIFSPHFTEWMIAFSTRTVVTGMLGIFAAYAAHLVGKLHERSTRTRTIWTVAGIGAFVLYTFTAASYALQAAPYDIVGSAIQWISIIAAACACGYAFTIGKRSSPRECDRS